MGYMQESKRHYKMYKSGRLWVFAGIMVMTVGVSPVIGHADTVTGTTGGVATRSTVKTSQAAGTSHVATLTSSSAPTASQQTGSAAQSSDETAVIQETKSAAPTTTEAADSMATSVTDNAQQAPIDEGNRGTSSSAVAESQPTTATKPAVSAPAATTSATSAGDVRSTAAQTTKTAGSTTTDTPVQKTEQAESKTASTTTPVLQGRSATLRSAAATDPNDEDVSDQFVDANLLAAVRKGFSLSDGTKLTLSTIKAYRNNHFDVKAYTVVDGKGVYQPVSSLQGLQLLANLPAGTLTTVDVQLAADHQTLPKFDFSPLASLKLFDLNLYTYYWGAATDEQLRLLAGLDTAKIHNVEFSSPSSVVSNPYGMTNRQFNILAPFVQAVIENPGTSSQMIGFSGNCITDFSALKNIKPSKASQVTGLYEYVYHTNKLVYQPGATVEVASEMTGVQGESLNYTVRYYQDDGTADGKLVQAAAHEATVTSADGTTRMVWKYTLVNPKVIRGNLIYGTFYYSDGIWQRYATDIDGNVIPDFANAAGALVYQPVTESQAQLTFNPSEVVMGPNASWHYLDHIASVTDYEGNPIAASEWSKLPIKNVTSLPDLTTAGTQNVEFIYTDEQGNQLTAVAVVKVLASQATITAQNPVTVWPHETSAITVADLVKNVTDASGQPVTDLTTVRMTAIDATAAGKQAITLTYVDAAGNQITTVAYVTVDLAKLTTKPVQVIAGPQASWNYGMHVTGVTNSLGQVITLSQVTVQVVTPPDLSPAMSGQPQTVVLAYTDDLGRTQTLNTVVTTVKSQAAITAKPDQVVWPQAVSKLQLTDLVHQVIGADGQIVTDLNAVTMTAIDAAKAGVQTVTLTYTDSAGNQVTTTANVTVDLAQLTTQDVQLVAGPTAKWNVGASLTHITDSRGQAITVDQAAIEVLTGPNLDGQLIGHPQTVVLAYTDDLGQMQRVTAIVTTVKSQAAIVAQPDRVVWPQAVSNLKGVDLVKSVTDADGQPVTEFTNVTMTAIDATKAGVQSVQLTYTDRVGNVVTATMNVTVDLAAVTTTGVQIIAGPNATWDKLANVVTVTDSLGRVVASHQADIKVVTGPDLSAAMIGRPQTVALAYTDDLGQTQRVTATVTTIKSQAQLTGRDITIIAGPNATWTLSDSIDWSKSVTMNGQSLTPMNLAEVTANSVPNAQVPGQYDLLLRYVDGAGNVISGTATVSVIASRSTLQVQDSQIKLGSSWRASDNLVTATDHAGNQLMAGQLTVTGTVDTNVAGVYQVTYVYTDVAGNVLRRTATVTVVANPTDPDDGDHGGTPSVPDDGGTTTDPGDNVDTTNPDGGLVTDDGTGDQVDVPDSTGPTNSEPDKTFTSNNGEQAATSQRQAQLMPVAHRSQAAPSLRLPAEKQAPSVGTSQPGQATILPQTDESASGQRAMFAGMISIAGLLGSLGAVMRRRRHN